MLGWRPLALGMASSLFFVAAAEAQQANSKRVATTEPLPATAPAVAPAPQPQDPHRHCASTETFGASESAR